ncbi:hypothetical protein ABZ883_24475 [Streptomyces sp. NPDC046977]|uniref:hypothetical protein n=1 Tax=Streptomyces sp. NPDC046977 TaxID=3154703 RepID=UPI0033C4BD50
MGQELHAIARDRGMQRVLLLIASVLVVVEVAVGIQFFWGTALGAGRVMCEWEAVGTQTDCSTTANQYTLITGAMLTALLMLCAAAVLGLPRVAVRTPRWTAAAVLSIVVVLNVYYLARWATVEEDLLEVVVTVYISAACLVSMRRSVTGMLTRPAQGASHS